jgi:hypothetical protein
MLRIKLEYAEIDHAFIRLSISSGDGKVNRASEVWPKGRIPFTFGDHYVAVYNLKC